MINTSNHIEDAKLVNEDINWTYIDFQNAFEFINHARLLAILEDLEISLDVVEIVGDIYHNSTTTFTGNHFGSTPAITISQGPIQGDTLNPYLFILFLKPLLRWLEKDDIGYHINTSTATCTTTTYANDLAIIIDNIQHIQPQILKLQKSVEWSHMDLNLSECVITSCPNKSKLKPNIFKTFIQS
jgi:hypothetical protein